MAVLSRAPFAGARVALLLSAVGLLSAPPLQGQDLTVEEALALAFPAADSVVRATAWLGDPELEAAARRAGTEVRSGMVVHYTAWEGGAPAAVAYFDPHRVRTLAEVLMVVVGRDGRVRRVEVVRFDEPPEYTPPEGWLAQFEGRALGPDLSLKGGIARITGATLTARAATDAVRRVLALHALVDPFGTGARP